MKTHFLTILNLVIILSWGQPCQSAEELGATVATVGGAVVFLRYEEQAGEMRDGQLVEIWHKILNSTNFIPKMNWKGGTAFIVKHNNRLYLVTAKHVAKDLPARADIILNTKLGTSTATVSFQTLQNVLPGSHWFYHTNADVAVHPFGIRTDLAAANLDESVFLPENETLPLLSTAYVFGFPLGQGVTQTMSPFAKQSQISSWITTVNHPTVRPDMKFILLDQALAEGYSGSPVFAERPSGALVIAANYKPPVWLIGIQSSALSDQTGGKLSVIVPLSYLREVFNSPELKTYEATTGQK